MMHPHPIAPARYAPSIRQTQRGSTLIEVLVAALILSIGIMALVGVQGSSVQMTKIAQQRGDASRLAQDFADRVRANANGNALNIYANPVAYNGNPQAQNIPATCKGNANCTTEDVARLDLAEMQEQARLRLPNGAFYVTQQSIGVAPNNYQTINVWVIWQTASTKSDESGTVTGLNCPPGAVNAGTPNTQCLLTRVML